jgi:hypothetical protein
MLLGSILNQCFLRLLSKYFATDSPRERKSVR